MRVYMYMYVYVCIYIYIYIHTYIHTTNLGVRGTRPPPSFLGNGACGRRPPLKKGGASYDYYHSRYRYCVLELVLLLHSILCPSFTNQHLCCYLLVHIHMNIIIATIIS